MRSETTGTPPHLSITRHQADGLEVLVVSGEIDVSTCALLWANLEAAIDAGGGSAVVDFSDLRFMDSTGLSVLIRAVKEAGRRGGSIAMRSVPANARALFEVAGLAEFFGLTEQ